MNFRYKMMQFMSGRNGPDELAYTVFAASVILSVVNIFVRSYIIQILVYALIIYALFRMFSRNCNARRRENTVFLDKVRLFSKKKELYNQRKADKCHVYKKCPKCSAVLRLPRRVGTHTTVCPKCGNEFKVKVRK